MFPISHTDDFSDIQNHFLPRITVVGHIIQKPKILGDGTVVFPVNCLAFVRGDMEASTVIGSIAPAKCWSTGPPVPDAFSPVHISGPLDCLDKKTLLPVIIVEDITLDIGDREIAELANTARIKNTIDFIESYVNSPITGPPPFKVAEEFFKLIPDEQYKYGNSNASIKSVPPYPNLMPYPLSILGNPPALKLQREYEPFPEK